MTEYHIDHQGIDGRWRVWWLGPDNRTCERLFDSRQAAQDWVTEMQAIESAA